jgi:hypothetical protein
VDLDWNPPPGILTADRPRRPGAGGGGRALPDGTPVIVSGGGGGGAVGVWQMADGVPVVPPLDLPESVLAIAVHGNVIITTAGADVAVHQPALPRPMR